MTRPLRLAAGWSIALAAAFLLNLALPHPTTAPQLVALAGQGGAPLRAGAPTPLPVAPAAHGGPVVLQPLTGGEIDGGSARLPELVALSPRRAAALQAATDRARRAFGLWSLAIGVSIRESTGWTGASGVALDGVTHLDGDSPFAIASITKTFTATLALQLVEAGRLSLNDRVADLLPGVSVPADVTVGQLMRHTSGIPDLLNPMRDRLNAAVNRTWRPESVVASVGQPWFPAGKAWAYSNTNYVLLGMIVERIGGQPFSTQLQDRLLSPLGLESTGMLTADGAPPLMAHSWASAFGTSGCMYASPHDLLRWGDALYGGSVLSPSGLQQMLDFGRHDFGLGVERLKVGSETGYGHSGLLRGFTSLLVRLPEQQTTLVVMGTIGLFDPAVVLAYRENGQPSILDLALHDAAVKAAA